jgi:hypothetical protein
MSVDEARRRLGVAQVEALFGSILVATSAAYFACVIVVAGLGSLGFVEAWTGFAWLCYVHVCALSNLGSYTSTDGGVSTRSAKKSVGPALQ